MSQYNPQKIEERWQDIWEKLKVFRAEDFSKKPKYYILVEFPYPSGEGLHVGHCRGYVGLDVIARKRRMEGYNVLFPMGWDAFGLPTENYAIKTGIHPAIATKNNTSNFKRQEKNLGLSFDWSREINTTDPAYYKWTQWIFIQLFKKGLSYKAKMPINWCPSCKIGLANEEVVAASCERCGAKVEKREKEQWMLKITEYAERLIKDLDKVDYPERVKISQKEWIGKSEGWEIKFNIAPKQNPEGPRRDVGAYGAGKFATRQVDSQKEISVFTTKADTLFGATYVVLSPEHPLIENLKGEIVNYKFVKNYIEEAKKKTDLERTIEKAPMFTESENGGPTESVGQKTGIEIKGIKAINPANNREMPVFAADYVLFNYGKGAIMAVPGHDRRDFDFAKRYNLPVREVITPQINADKKTDLHRYEKAYEGEGTLINSGRFDGIKSEVARERIGAWLAKKGLAKKATYYKLRDWIFSRQRYWGEPIPMINCQKCASTGSTQAGWQPVPEKDLPVELPKIEEYKPTEAGESPLAKVKNWVNVKCPKCGEPAQRETDVMPNWAGSNWYYLRYCDPKNDKKLADKRLLKYWLPIDWYNGGMEHTTLHLLYSRFIYKFLWDINAVPKSAGPEPYKKRTSHGVVLGEGGIKMSKSKGNVVNSEKVVKEYGADTMRVYEMFMGPFEQMIPWDTKGVKGARRFLERVWQIASDNIDNQKNQKTANSPELKKLLHKTIKKVSEDIDSLKFNTAISALMEFSNTWQKEKKGLGKKDLTDFLKILSPFAPHITEELWSFFAKASEDKEKYKESIFKQEWPEYDKKLVKDERITLIVQINGKVRDRLEVKSDVSEKEAKELVLKQEKIKKWLAGQEPKKIIFVPGKLINIVI